MFFSVKSLQWSGCRLDMWKSNIKHANVFFSKVIPMVNTQVNILELLINSTCYKQIIIHCFFVFISLHVESISTTDFRRDQRPGNLPVSFKPGSTIVTSA